MTFPRAPIADLLRDFDRELGRFWQVVPKEMLDRLQKDMKLDQVRTTAAISRAMMSNRAVDLESNTPSGTPCSTASRVVPKYLVNAGSAGLILP